jgi:hypothetical protein
MVAGVYRARSRPLKPPESGDGTYHTRPPQILPQRGVRRPAVRPAGRALPEHAPQPPTARKALTMRLRLHGAPCENRAVLAALATVLDIQSVSRTYPDRPPSILERIYIEAVPRTPEEATSR